MVRLLHVASDAYYSIDTQEGRELILKICHMWLSAFDALTSIIQVTVVICYSILQLVTSVYGIQFTGGSVMCGSNKCKQSLQVENMGHFHLFLFTTWFEQLKGEKL